MSDIPCSDSGWTWLHNSRKWHYFHYDRTSLCGKFMLLGKTRLEQGNDDSPDNCAVCKRKLKRLREEMLATAKARTGKTEVQ